eukprot:2437312-Rhodomonas_salina.2
MPCYISTEPCFSTEQECVALWVRWYPGVAAPVHLVVPTACHYKKLYQDERRVLGIVPARRGPSGYRHNYPTGTPRDSHQHRAQNRKNNLMKEEKIQIGHPNTHNVMRAHSTSGTGTLQAHAGNKVPAPFPICF